MFSEKWYRHLQLVETDWEFNVEIVIIFKLDSFILEEIEVNSTHNNNAHLLRLRIQLAAARNVPYEVQQYFRYLA